MPTGSRQPPLGIFGARPTRPPPTRQPTPDRGRLGGRLRGGLARAVEHDAKGSIEASERAGGRVDWVLVPEARAIPSTDQDTLCWDRGGTGRVVALGRSFSGACVRRPSDARRGGADAG